MTTKHSDATVKDRIDQAAIRLFATQGYAATAVREIVEAAGVSKPALYYYYENKEDLFRRLFFEVLNAFLDEYERRLREPGTLAQRIRRVVDLHFVWSRKDPWVARFMFVALFGAATRHIKEGFRDLVDRFHDPALAALREAAATGEIRPEMATSVTAHHLDGLVHTWILRNAIGMEDRLDDDLADQLVDLFMRGAGAKNPPASEQAKPRGPHRNARKTPRGESAR